MRADKRRDQAFPTHLSQGRAVKLYKCTSSPHFHLLSLVVAVVALRILKICEKLVSYYGKKLLKFLCSFF